ncbi:MAG: hypothetical protein K2Q01_11295, partial [Rickettsiales bacterium]|nr:hypothetical protein [Rickettsiales bacterium]
MKKSLPTAKQNAVLLTSVSSLVMLAGCDFTEMRNPFTPERPPQVVEGERRQPVYNQQMITRMQAKSGTPVNSAPAPLAPPMMAPPPAMPPAYVPPPAPPAPVAPPAAEAFSAPAPVAAAPVTPPPAPVAAAPATRAEAPAPRAEAMVPPVQRVELASMQEPAPSPKRDDSFFGRLFSDSGETTASTNPPPGKMREGVQEDYIPPEEENAPREMAEAATPAEAQATPAWADQWIGRKAPPISSDMQAERNAPYPGFDSVPPKPEEFETARGSAGRNLDELKAAQSRAEAERASLSSEPSQAYQPTPVDMPAPPANETPVQKTKAPLESSPFQSGPSQAAPAPSAPVMSYPGAPRRGVDIMTQEEWEALTRGQQPAATPQPSFEQRGDAGKETEEIHAAGDTEPPSFFARVFGSSDQEHADTDTQRVAPSDKLAELTPQTVTSSPEVAETEAAELQPEEPGQLSLLPSPEKSPEKLPEKIPFAQAQPEMKELPKPAPQATDDHASADWLRALVNNAAEAKAEPKAVELAQPQPEPVAASSPETQLLAQISAPLLPKEKSKPLKLSKKAAEKVKKEEMQLALLPEPAPAAQPAPVMPAPATEAPTQPAPQSVVVEPEAQAPSWMAQMFG